jgi:hypothetical protein
MFRISKDSPVHYITSVTHNRLPVFKTTKLKAVMCQALKEARRRQVYSSLLMSSCQTILIL